jgi:hypothetical protein
LNTAFPYQGQLKQGGMPTNGMADFEFTLWDAEVGGSQVGATQTLGNVTVNNGLFTVRLNASEGFGSSAFNGEARWLQVAVRLPHELTFTGLTPRQPLTAAPYALRTRGLDGHSLDAADGSPTDMLFVDNSGNVGIGTTTPSANLHVAGDIRTDGAFGLTAYNPNNASAVAALGWLNNVARIRIGGEGPGATNGLDIQKTGNQSLMRIYDSGDVWFRGTIDIGIETVSADCLNTNECYANCPPGKALLTGGCLAGPSVWFSRIGVNSTLVRPTWICHTNQVTSLVSAWAVCARIK